MEVFFCLTKLSRSSTLLLTSFCGCFCQDSDHRSQSWSRVGWSANTDQKVLLIQASRLFTVCFCFKYKLSQSLVIVYNVTSIMNVLFCDQHCVYWILWFNTVVSAASSNNSCCILLERFNLLIFTVRNVLRLLPTSFSKLFSCYYCPLIPTPQATGDPYYLEAGRTIMDNLNRFARVPCGFAAMKDVRTGSHEDRWEDKDLFFAFCRLTITLQP